MIDREKVIKGLECCIMRDPDDHTRCSECPYESTMCGNRLKIEALALLKAQDNTVCTKERCQMNASTISDDCNIKTCPWRTEAVEPKVSINGLWYECPVCGKHLTKYEDNYCSGCGKAVKWS